MAINQLIDKLRDCGLLREAARITDPHWEDDYASAPKPRRDYSIMDFAADLIRQDGSQVQLEQLLARGNVRTQLSRIIAAAAERDATTLQVAMRDVLTDLFHVAADDGTDIDKAFIDAGEVYQEELETT